MLEWERSNASNICYKELVINWIWHVGTIKKKIPQSPESGKKEVTELRE